MRREQGDPEARRVAEAEGRAALACFPRTGARVMWQADPASLKALVAACERHKQAGGTVKDFAAAVGVDLGTMVHLRAGRTPDGRHVGGPPTDASDAVREGAALVRELRARVRAAGLKRIDWKRYPDEVAALGRLWARSRLALCTFARQVDIDASAIRLHFRTAEGDTAREALADAYERIERLEARLADAERRAAERGRP